MKTFDNIYSELRKKNKGQYYLLFGCIFFSVLLITAYLTMMRSPMVLNVLPEGGDSRKQIMMIFVLAVLGCGVFVIYAANLFLREKSQEIGIFMALGATKNTIKNKMIKEIGLISLLSSVGGMVLGMPLAYIIWQLFKLFIVDTQEMKFSISYQSYLLAGVYSIVLIIILFYKLRKFIKRTNIIDIVNESKKSEPIKDIPRYFGILGIFLVVLGGFLGYSSSTFFIKVLKYYPPEILSGLFYIPAFIGLYMIMLHTVVNGWSYGKNRYNNLVSRSMIKFQGRQTVNNMLVITLLIAGAFFAAFYPAMTISSGSMGYENYEYDYSFNYREDQDMIGKEDIFKLAEKNNINIKDYKEDEYSVLGTDGDKYIEEDSLVGTSYHYEYTDILKSNKFLSESAYNNLTGENIDIEKGTVATIWGKEKINDEIEENSPVKITNMETRAELNLKNIKSNINNNLLFNYKIIDDTDYKNITVGLTDYWKEKQIFFNVDNVEETYDFAKELFYKIVDNSNEDIRQTSFWDPVEKMMAEEDGIDYWYDSTSIGHLKLDYSERDSTEFRMYWRYMPSFRVLGKQDFIKTTAVFLLLFVFIAIICFAAVIVIAYTRSITIALNNKDVFEDIKYLGAKNKFLKDTVKDQMKKIFFTPMFIGTILIFILYIFIMYANDGGSFSQSEILGLFINLIIISIISSFIYLFYRWTRNKIYKILDIEK